MILTHPRNGLSPSSYHPCRVYPKNKDSAQAESLFSLFNEKVLFKMKIMKYTQLRYFSREV